MATPAAVLQILVNANTATASAQLSKLDAQLKGTAATAGVTGKTIGSRLATGAKYGAVGLAALGAASVKMAVDFDKSMRNVNSIAQLNEKQFKSLEEQVKALAGKTAKSPKDLAEGLYDLVSSGFDAKESMKVLAASAKAATAGLTDTATSTKAVAAVLNAYRMPAEKAGKVSDVLFRTVDRGVISFEELASTIGNVLPAASTLGVKLPEVGAAIATLTKEGQSGASAVTNINAAMTALFKPSEDMKKAIKDVGYENSQAIVKAEGFEGALNTLLETTDGTTESVGKLFNNVRAQRAVFGLTGKNAADAAKDLGMLKDSAGATNTALEEQTKSVAYMWDKLKAQASVLAIDIGDKLLPTLKEMLGILTNPKLTLDEKVTRLGTKLTQTIEEWAPKVAKAGAVIGFAIIKGIWGAFWHSDLLGKLFIAGTFLRLVGGPGAMTAIGAAMGTPIGLAIATAVGAAIAAKLESDQHIVGKLAFKRTDFFDSDAFSGFLANVEDENRQSLYRMVRDWQTSGKAITKSQIMMWQEEGKITAHGAIALMDVLERLQKNNRQAFRALANATRGGGDAVARFTEKAIKGLSGFSQKQMALMGRVSDAFKNPFELSVDHATDTLLDFTKQGAKALDKFNTKSKRVTQTVGNNFKGLAAVVLTGLDVIVTNTNKALQGFGVKKVAISIAGAGSTAANIGKGFQRGGTIVPGQGDGDKVPAMLEPGEVVINKRAVAAMGGAHRADRINKMIPRFAKGGVVSGATGGLHPSILQFVSQLYQKYGGSVSSGVRAGDSGSLHSTGQAADYVPSNWAGAAAAANRAGPSLLEGIYNPGVHGGPAVSWDSGSKVSPGFWGASTWGGHLDHIHLAIADGTKAAIGATVDNIKRVLLKGPDGPLKDMGQGALDKVRDAANSYIRSKMPPIGAGKMHGPVKGLPDALQRYNRVYSQSSGFGDGYAMPFNAVAALGEWAGAPGVSMARTAIGESQLEPGAVGFDPGGTRGLGLWMITTGYNDALIKKLGGESQMRNPVTNAQAMNSIFQSQGIGAWYSQTADSSNTHYNGPLLRQLGGIVPGFAKGGKAELTTGKTDKAWTRFNKARKIARRLKEMLGERGRVARIDESIGIAETLAGLDSSPGGSELSPDELAKQIRLNEHLLEVMVRARKLSRTGLDYLDFPKGMSTAGLNKGQLKNLKGTLGSYLTDLTGVTGKGGRIFETKVHLDELRNTSTSTDNTAQLEELTKLLKESTQRYAISQRQYGVFAGTPVLGAMANGGMARRTGTYLVGERGPEMVGLRSGQTVTPGGVPSLTIEELNVYSDGRVAMKVGGKEFEAAVKKVTRRDARKGGRVLPGRAGS